MRLDSDGARSGVFAELGAVLAASRAADDPDCSGADGDVAQPNEPTTAAMMTRRRMDMKEETFRNARRQQPACRPSDDPFSCDLRLRVEEDAQRRARLSD